MRCYLTFRAVSHLYLADPSGNAQDISGVVRRPFEGELASVTLWPEIEKVFGHGYEVHFLGRSVSNTPTDTCSR